MLVEVDSNPPSGGKTDLSLVSRDFVFTVTHFDLPSLFGAKLHACFFRKYTKGRDIYDLIWYLGKEILPNFTVLNNAIKQTQHKNPGINKETFKDFLLQYLEKINFPAAKKDVERFLIDKKELELFNRDLLRKIVKSRF